MTLSIRSQGEICKVVPNFNGRWLLTATDDLNDLLAEQGKGWVRRRSSRLSKYGVGKEEQIIKMDGLSFEIDAKTWNRDGTPQKFVADGTGQVSTYISPAGYFTILRPEWEEDYRVLVCHLSRKDGMAISSLRRHLENDKMVMTIVTSSGTELRQSFSKRDDSHGQ